MIDCFLSNYGGHECGLGTHQHHWISKRQVQGCKRAQEFIRSHKMATVPVCGVHNAQTKLADTPEARRIIAARLCQEQGIEAVMAFLDQLRACFKLPPHDLTLEYILGI